MSWIIKPPTVEHVDHAWQPQLVGWDRSLRFALDGYRNLLDILERKDWSHHHNLTVTTKVDDRVSAKVAFHGNASCVGYKGRNSPWYSNEPDILSAYGDKPEVADALVCLLKAARSAPPRHGQYQVGILAWSEERALPERVVPNVVPYRLDGRDQHLVAVVPVSCSTDVSFLRLELGTTEDMLVVDNVVRQATVPSDTATNILSSMTETLESALIGMERTFLFGRIHHEDAYRELTPYLNAVNRDDEAWPSVERFVAWLSRRVEVEADKVVRQDSKDRVRERFMRIVSWVEDHDDDFGKVFRTVNHMRGMSACATRLVTGQTKKDSGGPVANEGLVFSHVLRDGTMTALKVVDPEFTRINHRKWSES